MLAWLLKKLKGDKADNSKTLEVIPVSDTKALHVVERGAKILLIEVEGERSQVISQVSDPNLVSYLKSAKGSLKGSAFLAQYLKRAASGTGGLDDMPSAAPMTPAAPKKETPTPAKAVEAELAAKPPSKTQAAEAAAAGPTRASFDFTVDDSTPIKTKPVEPKAPEPMVAEAEVLPAKIDLKPVVPRSEAANAIMAKLEKAMDRFSDNTGDGPAPVNDMLPGAIKISEPVTNALQEVVGRQQQRLDALKEAKRQEELEKVRVEGLLRRKREVEDKIGQIQEMLGRIDQDSGRNQPTVETSLLATSRDLLSLEEELSKIMTDPGVIKYLLQEREDFQADGRNPLDSIVNSVRTIERQRKQIAAIRHTREQAEAERRRVVMLLIRKNELETAIDEIKQVVKKIEDTNAEIIRMDPYAMPEIVPIVAMNELRRLEFEMNTILADAGVAKKLAEANSDSAGALPGGTMPQMPAI